MRGKQEQIQVATYRPLCHLQLLSKITGKFLLDSFDALTSLTRKYCPPKKTWLMTFRGREWTLGKPLGQGGFGAIYLTQPGNHRQVNNEAEYVVKVGECPVRQISCTVLGPWNLSWRWSLTTMVRSSSRCTPSSPWGGRSPWSPGGPGAVGGNNVSFSFILVLQGLMASQKGGSECQHTMLTAPFTSTTSSCAS